MGEYCFPVFDAKKRRLLPKIEIYISSIVLVL